VKAQTTPMSVIRVPPSIRKFCALSAGGGSRKWTTSVCCRGLSIAAACWSITSRKSSPFFDGSANRAWRRFGLLQMYCGVMSRLLGELSRLPYAAGADYVLDRHPQRRLLHLDAHGLHLDHLAQVLLQRPLHQELRGRGELVTRGSEYHLQQAAAQRRPVHPL